MKIFSRFFGRNDQNQNALQQIDKILFVLALIVLAVLFLFVSGPRKIYGTSPEVLVFTHWWKDELEPGLLESIIKEFETLNPGVHIKLQNLSYKELRESLTGSLPEEPGPDHLLSRSDIIALDPLWLQDLVQGGYLAVSKNGEAAVPLVSFMTLFFYNIEVLRSAGFTRPPRNWTELLNLSRTLAASDRYGLALSLSLENPRGMYEDLFPWFWASGSPVIRDGKPLFSGREVTGTLEFLDTLRRENLLSPGTFSKTLEQKREEFIRGRIGMMTGSIRDVAFLREKMKPGEGGIDRFGITAVPGPDTFVGKPAFGLSAWYVAVSAQSKHPEGGQVFLSFLVERAPLLAASVKAVPGSGDSAGDYILDDALYSKAWDMYEGAEIMRDFNKLHRQRELEALFRAELFGLFQGEQSPPKTAAEVQKGWETVLQ